MTIWVGAEDGTIKQVVEPYVGTPSGRKLIRAAWVGDANGTPRLVFGTVIPSILTATAVGWDTINLSWTNSGPSLTYRLSRGGSVVYQGTALSYSDAGKLLPNEQWNYTLETLVDGEPVFTSHASATTPRHAAMVLTASPLGYNSMALRWTDNDQRSINRYVLERAIGDNRWTAIDDGPDKGHDEGGLAEGGTYYYRVAAYRGSTFILDWSNVASGTTLLRTTSTGYAKTSKTHITSGGWCQFTQYNPSGGTLSFPVGGTMTSIVIAVWGRGANARVEPWVGGAARMHSIIGAVNVGKTNTFGLENIGFAAGTYSVGMRVGGSSPGISSYGIAEWHTWSPYSDWRHQVYVDGINYWYYNSLERDDEMRSQPWWREELAGRELHIESVSDSDTGEIIAVKVYDKAKTELIVDWERV